ncbi:MAG: rhodanese-related sulfurtransferase [Ignavibacteriales bacterium]|nr:rhodanese-related sulfurtransferase [Ignavibacteriales bacterium]
MENGKEFRLLSFYKYVQVADPAELQGTLLQYCMDRGIRGKIYVAGEGINGNVSATIEKTHAFKQFLRSDKRFSDVLFKEDVTRNFVHPKMFVRIKKELVNLGLSKISLANGGKRLSPEKLLDFYSSGKEFVIIDTRNTYESRIGHFKNALTPEMTNFREWEKVVDKLEDYKDKTVVTYCTGGIRCEKASAYMVERGFSDVYQLDGGIITYVKQLPDTVWEGGVFVFDDRKALEPNTREELKYTAACQHCGKPTVHYINCHNLDCDKIIVCCHNCTEEHQYCCSEDCKTAMRKRPKIYP